MSSKGRDETWKWVWSKTAALWILLPTVLITLAHYTVGAHFVWAHDVFRRLYYLPILVAALTYGLRGAMTTSVLVTILYSPHAFTHMFVHDPGHSVEKALELLLYNVIGAVTGVLASKLRNQRDELKRTAEQLAEKVEQLERMETQLVRAGKLQALGELTAGLAHEIKNPLASMKGATEIIADEIPSESPRRQMIEILNLEIDRLTALLDEFLKFARRPSFELDDIRLAEVMGPMLDVVRAQARRHDVEIEGADCSDEAVVRGNRENLSLVFMNLLINATQAMPDGGTVRVGCRHETRGTQSYWVVSIEDSGPGIPDQDKERVFNPFYTTKHDGTGLGLSIAARVIEAHNGFIEVEDAEPKGTIFRVGIPSAHVVSSKSIDGEKG